MDYAYRKPPGLISDYVRTVLLLEGSSTPASSDLPLVTNGIPALFCSMEKKGEEEHVTRLTLYGKSIPSECWEAGDGHTIIAFFFKPFALAGFFNLDAKKLLDTPTDLHTWSPHTTNALRTQLVYAKTALQKADVLGHFLVHQFEENRTVCEIIRQATDEIMCHPEQEAVAALPEKLNLTPRTFQRMFKKYVGITASQYRRICQFQVSFAQVRAKEFTTLTEVAFDNGFADQSHFIRSFKEFADTTPNNYLREGLKPDEKS